jgi:hypothetical protein
MAELPNAKLSILVTGDEFEAGRVALSSNGQLHKILGIIGSMQDLSCAQHIAGQQCRVEAGAKIDDHRLSLVNIEVECPLKGPRCQDTCDGLVAALKSNFLGAGLCFEEEIAFID